MKIETSISLRKDGSVRVVVPSGLTVVFTNDAGRLVADVANSSDLSFLLSTGNFYPADEEDHPQAEDLIRPAAGAEVGPDDLPDDDGDENAAPVEAVTPPKPGKLAKASK